MTDMNKIRPPRKTLLHLLAHALLLVCLTLQPMTAPAAALPMSGVAERTAVDVVQVIIQEPALFPALGPCDDTYWISYENGFFNVTYVTLNNSITAYNSGAWRPNLPQSGFYKVEAFIAGHPPVVFCKPVGTYTEDTHAARYEINHKYGASVRHASQDPLVNEWLNLGVYEFNAGTAGFVTLSDLTGEASLSKVVNFSAMRFTLVPGTTTFFPVISIHRPIPTGEEIQAIKAQGFDLCHPPTVTQMNNWWINSPYRIFGLYLGGAMFSKDCEKANAAWVQQVRSIGWTFIPTWVGPQAPCTTYFVRFGLNGADPYTQGRQEADLAVTAAGNMGLLPAAGSKTILYYDMEGYYPADTSCRTTVKSFLNGWSSRLHELGFKSGSYGSACSSYVTDWASIPNPLDDVWIANWYSAPSSYDPNASVFGLSCVSNTLWPNHQRIRQYTEPHDETWGGKRLHIDSDVADGEVAAPNILSLPQGFNVPLAEPTPYVQAFQFVDSSQGWLLSGSRLYWTEDGGLTWQKQFERRVVAASFLDASNGWILAESSGKGMPLALYRIKDALRLPDAAGWEEIPFPLPAGEWQVIQMEFNSEEEGWIVLRLATNSGIQQGLLMRTHDGGDTWENSPLSPPEAVYFTSINEAWMPFGENDQKLYQITLNTVGNLQQQPAQPAQVDLLMDIPPDGFTQSAGTRSWRLIREQSPDVLAALPVVPVQTFFVNAAAGWALVQDGNCSGEKGTSGFTCTQHASFWRTSDQGVTWQEAPLP